MHGFNPGLHYFIKRNGGEGGEGTRLYWRGMHAQRGACLLPACYTPTTVSGLSLNCEQRLFLFLH